MDPKTMTNEQIRAEMEVLRADREYMTLRLGELSLELLAREAPNQMTLPINTNPPLSLYGGW